MSKTFKTRPEWVKLKDYKFREERHYHERGVCDLDPDQRMMFTNGCYATVSYFGDHSGFYPRKGAHLRWARAGMRRYNGKCRTQLRTDLRNLLKSTDVEDYDVVNPRGRNSVLWDL